MCFRVDYTGFAGIARRRRFRQFSYAQGAWWYIGRWLFLLQVHLIAAFVDCVGVETIGNFA